MAINNETYFEFDEDINEGFTTVPNYILNDTRLTYKAIGVYVQILQYRNTGKHKIYIKSLGNYRQDKKTAVSTGIQELEKYGYIVRIQLRNEKGHMNGVKYIVRMKPYVEHTEITTIEPKPENLISENPISENTLLKIKYNKNKINKKENNDDDDESKLIELYKTFKLEKRVMPHTIKFLKQNSHISLDVFEQIFINASEDGVVKKYSYIKSIVENLNDNNVTTLSDFEKYNDNFKKSKTKKTGKGSSTSKNKFHNTNSTFDKYDPRDLEKILMESQKDKFPKPNKPEFHNFNEIEKSNGNSEEWGC